MNSIAVTFHELAKGIGITTGVFDNSSNTLRLACGKTVDCESASCGQ